MRQLVKKVGSFIRNHPLLFIYMGLAVLLLYILYKRYKRKNKEKIKVDLTKDPVMIADALYYAMRGFGTDEAALERIYSWIRQGDVNFLEVYNAFGLRSYFSKKKGSDLLSWIKGDCDRRTYTKWKDLAVANGLSVG